MIEAATSCRLVARTVPALLLLLVATAWVNPTSAAPSPQDGETATVEDPAAALEAARAALADGTAPAGQLGIHAKTVLVAGDLDALGEHLRGGREPVIEGVLTALTVSGAVVLVPEVRALAVAPPTPRLGRLALTELRRMSCADATVRTGLFVDLANAELPSDELSTLIEVVGACGDLAAVDVLLNHLGGPLAERTHTALKRLTGYDPRPIGDSEAWAKYWEANRNRTREQLLENALTDLRRSTFAERANDQARMLAMQSEVIQARIALMGFTVEALITSLEDDYATVRLTATQRLSAHEDHEQAVRAVPVLLARLGVQPSEGSNGHAVEQERSARVRAEVVAALGVLGPDRDDVVDALLVELSADDASVATAALGALSLVRDRSRVVQPLLAFAERRGSRGDEFVSVFGIVANNQPIGMLDEIGDHLDRATEPAEESQIVRALLACDDLFAALELLGDRVQSPVRDVRFALATGLGDRLRSLPEGVPERDPALVLLSGFVDDPDTSVRTEAVTSLGESGSAAALASLEARALIETDPGVSRRIVRALGMLGDPDGTDTLGRLCAAEPATSPIWEEGRKALLAIGSDLDAVGWNHMGETLLQVRAFDLAELCQNEIISPSRVGAVVDRDAAARARGSLAEIRFAAGRHREALDLLEALHDEGAPFPEVGVRLQLMADCAEALELPEQASGHLRALRELLTEGDPRTDGINRRLAATLLDARQFDMALIEYVALTTLHPDDNDLMHRLARTQRGLGDDRAAHDLLQRLLQRIPQDHGLRAVVLADLEELGFVEDEADPDQPPAGTEGDAATDDEAPATGTEADGAAVPEPADEPTGGPDGMPSGEGTPLKANPS